MSDVEKIKNLRLELEQHLHAYHVLNSPTVSDSDYDRLFLQLQELEIKNPECADINSPTSRVGLSVPNSFKKVRHSVPMMSLENSFTAAEAVHRIHTEAGDCEVILEPKIDGLALTLFYDQGSFTLGVTRGDHETGDDITANVRTIKSVPLHISYPGQIEIRGEAFLSKDRFEKLNQDLQKKGEEQFANARNAASGSLKLKDSSECAERQLDFFVYQIVNAEQFNIETQYEALCWLATLGFKVSLPMGNYPVFNLTENSEGQLQKLLDDFNVSRKNLPYDTDGCVIKVNSIKTQKSLGNKTRAPRWATAFKFPSEKAVTTLLGITCQVGRLGRITPVANLKPIEVSGAVVSRATLNNQDYIEELDLNVGDTVELERSGEVIPKITAVVKKNSEGLWRMIVTCPCCNSQLVRDGVNYFCRNDQCPDQVHQRLQHVVSKSCLDWDGFGEAAVETVIKHGAKNLSDLLTISEDDAKKIFKPAMQKKFLLERERIKTVELWRKIYALGIELVGQTASKDLASKWSSLEEIVNAPVDEVMSILGPVAYNNFYKFLENNVDELELLEKLGYMFIDKSVLDLSQVSQENKPLIGKLFVITGSMMSGTREQVSKTIEKYGGTVKGSVTKQTSYLISGDGGGANKAAGAAKLGIPVIDEESLYKMIGIEMPVVEFVEDK